MHVAGKSEFVIGLKNFFLIIEDIITIGISPNYLSEVESKI